MKKAIKAWAMFDSDDVCYVRTIEQTQKEVIERIGMVYGDKKWPKYRDKYGCSIRRITIIVED
jgi:hypothetical protein